MDPDGAATVGRQHPSGRVGRGGGVRGGGVCFALRWIPPGRFWMGSPEDEPGRFDREGPRHEVELSHGYWLGETPVTQGQWRAVVEAGPRSSGLKARPSYFKGPGSLPVESVFWDDTMRWLQHLTVQRGEGPSSRCPPRRSGSAPAVRGRTRRCTRATS